MALTTTSISIASRIEWCRQQSMHACSPRETTGWEAEEDGLWDSLLNRDHSNQYQQGPPDVLARYVMGLQDGRAMMRMTTAYHQVAPRTSTARTKIPQRQTRNPHASHIR
jgi:hypothetical protein